MYKFIILEINSSAARNHETFTQAIMQDVAAFLCIPPAEDHSARVQVAVN